MAINPEQFFERRTLCLITGANRGLGKALALEFGRRFTGCSQLVLTARKEDALAHVQKQIAQLSDVKISSYCIDFENAADSRDLKDFLNHSCLMSFDQALIIHNAGTVGDIRKNFLDWNCHKELRQYFDVNLVGALKLNADFWSFVKTAYETKGNIQHRYCVNISSLLAIQALKGFGMYCAGKAARDMAFSVLAAEEPEIRVLNYAPGPLRTDMTDDILKNHFDADVRKMFTDTRDSGQSVEPTATAQKLCNILIDDSFKTGAHVDFFDS